MMNLDLFSSDRSQISKFAIVGVLGNSLGWVIYTVIYHLVPVDGYRPTISWFISYHFGILMQHHLHRRHTFAEKESPYLVSLIRTYLSYLLVLIFSLIANLLFNEYLNIYHHFSLLLTIILAVPISYLSLKYFSFGKTESATH